MSVAPDVTVTLQDRFSRELPEMAVRWQAEAPSDPQLLVLNEPLAAELGLDAAWLRSSDGLRFLVGSLVPRGAAPVAQAYAGHQFGGFVPRLGDGRALLLGELIGADGRMVDIHLKGSGPTPFARGGDGLAAVGPMLREYIVSEAMHALGVPTTRSLAVVGTGRPVRRETLLPGAVLARVASSHLRVGSFQYAASTGDVELVRRLADHAIARHHPTAAEAERPYRALFEAVVAVQASLIARWMLFGFVHGVMNTDNMTISGETIDYGPCAFMEAYDPDTVFSSIDSWGRYAYGNQPVIAGWNLARFAETLLPLLSNNIEEAIALAEESFGVFHAQYDLRVVIRYASQTWFVRGCRGPGRHAVERRVTRPIEGKRRRLHLVLPSTQPRGKGRCQSPTSPALTTGCRVGEPWARTPNQWIAPTRSTFRATIWSRRR